MKPGVLTDDFIVEDHPVYNARFYCDEFGISHLNKGGIEFMKGTVINNQGFRGNWDYTKENVDSIKNTGKRVVMLVGDSYTEGCCADKMSASFPDLMNNKEQEIMNFGVSCADPLQYKLIAENYVEGLMPDALLIVVYLGNDIMMFNRTPKPGIPLAYPFANNKWLMSDVPFWITGKYDEVFETPEKAYQFYLNHYSLKGDNRNFIEKMLGYSVITSKLYLGLEMGYKKYTIGSKLKDDKQPPYTYQNLLAIKSVAKKLSVPVIFVAIPAPKDSEGFDKSEFDYVFNDIEWYVPENLTLDDYDGASTGNHFNNAGHQKFKDFLNQLLNDLN